MFLEFVGGVTSSWGPPSPFLEKRNYKIESVRQIDKIKRQENEYR